MAQFGRPVSDASWRPGEGILRVLLRRQGYRCFWCGYPVVELSQVNRSGNRGVLAANETHVIYFTEVRREKRVFRAARANVGLRNIRFLMINPSFAE